MTIRGIVANFFMRICSVLPLQDKIVFSCFYGNTFGDNPEVIFKEIRKKHLPVRCIWLMSNNDVEIEGADVVSVDSFSALYHLSTAKLWIDNSRKKDWVFKRKNQYYVQTWHGDVCLKKIERDAIESIDSVYIKYAQHDSKMADLMLSGSTFRTGLYEKSFWYSGEILEYGTPKSVVFYENPEIYKRKVRDYFSIDADVRIAIYCPTFRATDDLNLYNIDYERLIYNLEQETRCRWVVLVRLHPKINTMQGQLEYSERVLNASNYVSVDELIIASDLVITDYSGCMFSGLEANKPVLLYAVDVENYMQTDRGFYFDINALPFPLAQGNDELEQLIKNFDSDKYKIAAEAFKDKIGFKTNVKTTEKVVQYILNKTWKGVI